jgi:hypothetical protein
MGLCRGAARASMVTAARCAPDVSVAAGCWAGADDAAVRVCPRRVDLADVRSPAFLNDSRTPDMVRSFS